MFNDPTGDPPHRYLRALDIQTGKIAWEIDQKIPGANYGGVLSTAGGVVFYTESTGAFAAVDAKPARHSGISRPGNRPRHRP